MTFRKAVKITAVALAAILAILLVLSVVLVLMLDRVGNRVAGHPLPTVTQRARELHFSSVVADLHSEALMWSRDLLARNRLGHVDLPRLDAGGVTLQGFSVATNFPLGPEPFDRKSDAWPDYFTAHALVHRWPRRAVRSRLERALHMAGRLHDAADRSGGRLAVIRTAGDLERIAGGRGETRPPVGALLSLEGAHALEGRLGNLRVLHDAGFRVIGLTHFIDNAFAGSATGMQRHGLTPLGRELLAEMDRLGAVPDIAHASTATILDVLAATDKPVLVSHTGLRATCDMGRNLSDDEIRAIGSAGGVIGISFGGILICGERVEDIVRSIRHVAVLVGDEHVALGSDFDGGVTAPFDAAGLPALTQAMLDAGFTEDSVRRILGGNVLRVLRAWLHPP